MASSSPPDPLPAVAAALSLYTAPSDAALQATLAESYTRGERERERERVGGGWSPGRGGFFDFF